MRVTIIGVPCGRTQQALLNARAAVGEFDKKPKVHWITDPTAVSGIGRVLTPTVIMNGRIKVSGHVPSVYEIMVWIEQELEEEIV